MAITAAERNQIIELTVLMFNAAPGATYLSQIVALYEANPGTQAQKLQALANQLAQTSVYRSMHPNFETAEEFAASFLTPLGLQNDAVAKDFVIAKVNAGVSKGQITYDAYVALNAVPSTGAAQYVAANAILNNKTTVAEYYSVTVGGAATDLGSLTAVLANVTAAESSVVTAKAAIDSGTGASEGNVFPLTTSTDILTGTANNDVFAGTAATTGGTFNAGDSLNGASGTDTFNLTLDTLAANSVPGGTTTGIEVINVRNVSGNAQTVAAGNFAGRTNINSDRSADALTVTGLTSGVQVGVVGNGSVANGASTFTFGNTVTSSTINISGGTTAGAVTINGTGMTSHTVNSTGAANTVGAIALSGTANNGLTINATTALTTTGITGFTGAAPTITVTGAATSTSGVGATIGTLEAGVTALNASGMTAGGVSAMLNANAAIVVTGGAGNDFIRTGAALTTGSVSAGAGTGDRLVLGADAHINTLTLGNKYSGFEVVEVGALGATNLDLDLLATNNSLTGLRITGSAAATNVSTAVAGNVTMTASNTSTIAVKGALNPGQIDTINLVVSDGAAAVSTITVTTPTIAGVEILNVTATDNATVTSLANALALTNVNVTGAGATSITTGAIALQTNFAVNAGAATGNLTFDATGSTTNGFSVIGSSGINTITGGNQVFSANIAASTAKADVITVTNATGGTISLPNATITGFTNSATVTVGDKLDVIGGAAVQADVAAATATGIANLTGAVVSGIMTFAGTAAATATLTDKINAAASANFAGAANEVVAFEHGGNTYIVSQQNGDSDFDATVDLMVQLTGVTGITALSAAASGATTVWVA